MDRKEIGLKYAGVFDVLKFAFWHQEPAAADEAVYRDLRAHAIQALPAPVLCELSLPPALFRQWKQEVVQHVIHYHAYLHAQHSIPLTVPYVILKGTSAAQYYPCPEYRSMGDIDLMTRREDYETACRTLLENGYLEVTDENDRRRGRHREFSKNGISIEVHRFFASMNDLQTVMRFDSLILSCIGGERVLPDMINGLTLLEHIDQHMENGLGLRQIIDWMMFANRCLDGEGWKEFQPLAREMRLENLAVTVTRMCEMFLGFRENAWCGGADEQLCADLMEYVMCCGDFGGKMDRQETLSTGRAEKLRHPVAALRELQRRGEENWPGAKKPLLRPFAWMWQGYRFFRDTDSLAAGYVEALRRDKLFDALGVRREAKGLVSFENGILCNKHTAQ